MSIIAYKFQAPNGSYWYIRADDKCTIDYWVSRRALHPLTDDDARIAANGAVVEFAAPQAPVSAAPVAADQPALTADQRDSLRELAIGAAAEAAWRGRENRATYWREIALTLAAPQA